MTPTAPLFRGLQFYLTRSLSPPDAAELRRLIEQYGGAVSDSPAGATQLVDYEALDARRPEWVSTEYISDSVAAGALQDPASYSGALFTGRRGGTDGGARAKRKLAYSAEDDARMLHFAKLRGWKSMDSVPQSAWVLAEHEKVTGHSSQSMHEHFRKQLRGKTPKEQRDIMAKAAALIRARLERQLTEEEEKEGATMTPPPSTTTPEPTIPAARAAPATPATSSPAGERQRGGNRQQKRKRSVENNVEMETSSARRETDTESNRGEDHDTHGVFFRSAWTDLVKDPLKRASLRALFRPTPQVEEAPPGAESSRAQSIASESRGSEVPTEILAQDHNGDGGEELEVEFATDPETDEILSRLQLETNQEMPCVVHALYYCNGNTDMAREFLKGASPAGMWSPDDDLLLVNLVAEENIDRSGVDAAVVRGDFATMRLHRDTDAILHRIQFLR